MLSGPSGSLFREAALFPLIIAWVVSGLWSLPPNIHIEYPAHRTRLGASIADLVRSYPPLPALPPDILSTSPPIRIVLADSDQHFDILTGGRIPEWGAGVADPEAGLIIVPGYAGGRAATSDMRKVLRHELAHVALHRYLAPGRVPRWFNEGYATWSAGQLDVEGGWILRVAFALDRAPPLDSLELSWPRATADARVAYLLSASVVEYLVRESGEAALTSFLQRWRTSQDMEQALAQTYGISIDQLERHWRRDVKRRYGWLAVLTQSAVVGAGAAVVLMILFAIRRRRDRRKLALLEAAELPDRPAFWDGEQLEDLAPEDDARLDKS